ncbi:lysophospholipid acyltransferase family protein [Pannonibacter tanglangensis]|uniref:KDO2-lipid IV(A) lauroyltransferase n=1 Tax=Pannonibacter tanglangensis TaxID=2750084 RepID=A0ABW9ZCC2_9HYPH|nr:lysophospholipid acyltransferase family protein [Pannonibacter sp. XCT-34]NBN62465.1 hypothetical protein [Pannonibacter sp. XCT-34]
MRVGPDGGDPCGRKVSLTGIPFDVTRASEPPAPPLRDLVARDRTQRARAFGYHVGDRLTGLSGRLLHELMRHLPPAQVSWIGSLLGGPASWLYRRRIFARRMAANLRHLRPDVAAQPALEAQLLRRWWGNTGRAYAEYASVERLWPAGLIEVHGREHHDAALQDGRGVIFACVHLGNWEGLAACLPHLTGGPVIGTYQDEPNRFTNRLIHALRKRRGQYIFPPGRASAGPLYRLTVSRTVTTYLYVDEVRDRQVHMPLFGREIPETGNIVNVVKLARSASARIVPAALIRGDGPRLTLTLLPAIEPQELETTIRALDAALTPLVLAHLDQWYMLPELRLPQTGA